MPNASSQLPLLRTPVRRENNMYIFSGERSDSPRKCTYCFHAPPGDSLITEVGSAGCPGDRLCVKTWMGTAEILTLQRKEREPQWREVSSGIGHGCNDACSSIGGIARGCMKTICTFSRGIRAFPRENVHIIFTAHWGAYHGERSFARIAQCIMHSGGNARRRARRNGRFSRTFSRFSSGFRLIFSVF